MVFTTTLDPSLNEKLRNDLTEQGFEFSKPDYTVFAARKKGISCTLYQSGKLVVQGKAKDEFIEFYLEPELLKSFDFTYKAQNINKTPHIGVDESGKGDFFGPLCVAALYADEEGILKLIEMGVTDSKKITDKKILPLAKKIRASFDHHILKINPLKYNELYQKFGNLNHMLGWGHATTIEALVTKTACKNVIIDQFANESVVIRALKQKDLDLNLTQRHRAEADPVVAGASILARAAFVEGIEQLSQQCDILLAKGASNKVIQAGRDFARKHGKEKLPQVCKMHFKTLDAITDR